MLTLTLYGPRSTRVEYVANQNGTMPEGSEPPKTNAKKIIIQAKFHLGIFFCNDHKNYMESGKEDLRFKISLTQKAWNPRLPL
ncbi:hypothetical protein CPT03_07325 [Pedobacter ginsengisoli]|uniref:Uncharacterized protein n=1 Tax=Pedobacter ginsengisoli TaxID=363852 RepID=A0A2D1U3Y4_9SPHI|nr:hypothetical protein CPT03_07325 [Pedobacter ginsengisoli]